MEGLCEFEYYDDLCKTNYWEMPKFIFSLHGNYFAWDRQNNFYVYDVENKLIMDIKYDIIRDRNLDGVSSYVFSNNEKTLVFGTSGGLMRIYDIQQKKILKIIDVTTYWVSFLLFIKNDTIMISGLSSGEVIVWNTTNWEKIKHFEAHENWIVNCSISPNNKILVTIMKDDYEDSEYNSIALWDTSSWSLIKTLKTDQRINGNTSDGCSKFSPDGKLFICSRNLSYSRESFIVFETQSWTIINTNIGESLNYHKNIFSFLDNRNIIYNNIANGACIYNFDSHKIIKTVKLEYGHTFALTSPNNKYMIMDKKNRKLHIFRNKKKYLWDKQKIAFLVREKSRNIKMNTVFQNWDIFTNVILYF
jgi:WD40 repeat protein